MPTSDSASVKLALSLHIMYLRVNIDSFGAMLLKCLSHGWHHNVVTAKVNGQKFEYSCSAVCGCNSQWPRWASVLKVWTQGCILQLPKSLLHFKPTPGCPQMIPTIDLTVPVCNQTGNAQNAGKSISAFLLSFLELLLNACGGTEMRIELITYQTRNELFSKNYLAFPFSGVRPHLESHQSEVAAFMYTWSNAGVTPFYLITAAAT